ncbi:MAG: hypothetical protein IPJ81_17735 [Chitinophagaceae bacterium]|nr:hypothetical protein [Chitinophagaceae bacterium]
MTLKKLIKAGFIALLISFTLPVSASVVPASNLSDSTYDKVREEQILTRLGAIQNMDLANLSTSEKKDLRKELKKLKKEASTQNSQGIYLSVGAVIIIVLLLILLL